MCDEKKYVKNPYFGFVISSDHIKNHMKTKTTYSCMHYKMYIEENNSDLKSQIFCGDCGKKNNISYEENISNKWENFDIDKIDKQKYLIHFNENDTYNIEDLQAFIELMKKYNVKCIGRQKNDCAYCRGICFYPSDLCDNCLYCSFCGSTNNNGLGQCQYICIDCVKNN